MPLDFQVGGSTRSAALWLPPDFDPSSRWPLIVCLHGYEERGDRLEHVGSGLGRVLAETPDLYRAVVVLPQCPDDRVWSWIERPWAQGLEGAEEHVDAVLSTVQERYPIDVDRIALTGNSMGGFGTFLIGGRRPGRFHALLPICGGGEIDEAGSFGDVSLWIHHGAADDVVEPEESVRMADAIRGAGGSVRLDLYDDVGHLSWDAVWRRPEVAEFLIDGRLPAT